MTVSIHGLAIMPCVTMLETLAHLLKKAGAEGDLALLLRARLAPDMLPLRAQVQIAAHQAKEMAARLMREPPPVLETPHCSPEVLQVLLAETVAYLRGLDPRALVHAGDLQLVLDEGPEGVVIMRGPDYVRHWALPNFYFHVVTAYDILRHAGVRLGKADYLVNVERYRVRPVLPMDGEAEI